MFTDTVGLGFKHRGSTHADPVRQSEPWSVIQRELKAENIHNGLEKKKLKSWGRRKPFKD